MSELNETQPTSKKTSRSGIWIGLLIVVLVLVLASFIGYSSGIGARKAAESTQIASALGEQMSLVDQDVASGRYDVARQRLEYIINQNPDFPGAVDKLTEIILAMSITPTATVTPTPTLTPTPDLRAQEAIFADAQQQLAAQDWNALQSTLDSLRKKDPNYHTAEVDAMYYAVFRNRGVAQILGTGAYAQTTNLEGGIYDLTLAERFGPLDGTADGLRNFARLYIQGATYWELDWEQAINYFSQVYSYTPNLRDSSNFTATERYRLALLGYADQLYVMPGKDHCRALEYYQRSFSIAQDPSYNKKYNDLNLECNPPTNTPEPATATPEVVVPPPSDATPTTAP